jgi:hypothetical protein
MLALILFYFHREAYNIEEFAKFSKYIEILEQNKLLPTPVIPLKFE